MNELISLELKKFNIKKNIFAVFICNLCMLGLFCFMLVIGHVENDMPFGNYKEFFSLYNTLVNVVYIIFASFLISKFIIEEYKSKTILQLFIYPISRKKVLFAKICIVSFFTFFSTIIAYITVFWSFYLVQIITNTTFGDLTIYIVFTNIISVLISAICNSIIGLIPLYFGMKKKSVPITILSAIIISCILNSNSNGFTLSSIVIIPILFCIIGIITVFLSIKDIDKEDVS